MTQGFIMFDAHERIAVYNERYIEMYGLSREIVKPGCSFLELLEHRAALGNLKARLSDFTTISWPSWRRVKSRI